MKTKIIIAVALVVVWHSRPRSEVMTVDYDITFTTGDSETGQVKVKMTCQPR
jgi:hypothetical protein